MNTFCLSYRRFQQNGLKVCYSQFSAANHKFTHYDQISLEYETGADTFALSAHFSGKYSNDSYPAACTLRGSDIQNLEYLGQLKKLLRSLSIGSCFSIFL